MFKNHFGKHRLNLDTSSENNHEESGWIEKRRISKKKTNYLKKFMKKIRKTSEVTEYWSVSCSWVVYWTQRVFRSSTVDYGENHEALEKLKRCLKLDYLNHLVHPMLVMEIQWINVKEFPDRPKCVNAELQKDFKTYQMWDDSSYPIS